MTLRHRLWTGVRVILKHTLNRLTRRVARTSHGPFAIVRHIGRRSGNTYETPIIAAPTDNGFIFELTYGPKVDWYQNVLAAGGCTLIWHGKAYALDHPEPLDAATGRSAYPPFARLILGLTGRRDFVRLAVAPPATGGANQ